MIEKVTLKEQVYYYLRKGILNGDLVPGRIYSEQSFADLLTVSRTPVREAVLHLKEEGLLEIHPNKGVSVKVVTAADVRHMVQLRVAIEGYCSMYLAENIGRSDAQDVVRKLGSWLNVVEDKGDDKLTPTEYMEGDAQFHMDIVRFTENYQMISIMQGLRSRIDSLGAFTLRMGTRMKDALDEHQEILLCIRSGDSFGAYSAIRAHLKAFRNLILSSEEFKEGW